MVVMSKSKLFFLFAAVLSISFFVHSTSPSVSVPVIYESGVTFGTQNQVRDYFYSNFETIKEATVNFDFRGTDSSGSRVEGTGIPRSGVENTFSNSFQKDYIIVEDGDIKTCIDKICSSTPIQYVAYIPYNGGENFEIKNGWPFRTVQDCKDPTEESGVDTQGEFECPGSEVIEKQVPVSGVRYFVGENGEISYAFSGKPAAIESRLDFGNVSFDVMTILAVIAVVVIGVGLLFYFKHK